MNGRLERRPAVEIALHAEPNYGAIAEMLRRNCRDQVRRREIKKLFRWSVLATVAFWIWHFGTALWR